MPNNKVDESTGNFNRGIKELTIGITAMIPIIIATLALLLMISWPFIEPYIIPILEKMICK